MTLLLTALLSVLMGTSLGLLGGGGSILAVPILLYVVGLTAKQAIATSLLVVGVTSIAVTLQHARVGHVRWKKGFIFGGFAMIGAVGGGVLADFVSGALLLLLFAGMMVAAAVAMLRPRRSPLTPGEARSLWKVGAEGLVVGAFTGLVGAGGGFMVVPALVLLGGMEMRDAVGTSTLVIALKSFAALAGYATHVPVDLGAGALVGGFAVVGSLGGAWLAHRIDARRLRGGFGVFLLVMAAFVLYREAPPAAFAFVLEHKGLLALAALAALLGWRAVRSARPAALDGR